MTDHTADTSFEPFGKCYPSPADPEKDGLSVRECTASSRKAASLSVFPCEVRIECPPGTARLLVASSPELTDFRTFPLRNHVRLKPGVPFCVIPLYTPLAWRMLIPRDAVCEPEIRELSSPYTWQPVSIPFHVRRILDCWFTKNAAKCRILRPARRVYELLYVYEGQMKLSLSSGTFGLQPHDLMIYRSETAELLPSEGCSFLTAVFDVNQRKSLHILNHVFHCNSELQQILWKLLIESMENTYYTGTFMVCYLQEALLLLMQFYETVNHKILISENRPSRNDLLSEILSYMNKRITDPVTIEEICREFYISRSSLQALFRTHLNTSPKNYLLNIKLQKSKELIRENEYTISEIAYRLGFSSIHYFSRLFRKYFNTTPTAYARKIAENKNQKQL